MDHRELCYLPATQALALFRKRELSPVELLQALIRRAEEVEPKINAFTERYLEGAHAAEQRPPVGSACRLVAAVTESLALRAAGWC